MSLNATLQEPLLKVPLMLTTAVVASKALTPPNPPANKQEQVAPEGLERLFAYIVRYVPIAAEVGHLFTEMWS
jgi:hypothetical protein